MRDIIIFHSQYNLVKEGMQSSNRYFVLPNQSLNDIPKDVRHLNICGYEYYKTSLNFFTYEFTQLQSISIGNRCFQTVRNFMIDGLEELKTLKIGDSCFKISGKESKGGLFRITKCPSLCELEIGEESFSDYTTFELFSVDSLRSIKFGAGCFEYAEEFSMRGNK